MSKLVITGTALVTPAGVGPAIAWDSMVQGRTYLAHAADRDEDAGHWAGPWPSASVDPAYFAWPTDDPWWVNNRKYTNTATEMIVAVARQAIAASGPVGEADAARCAVVITMGGADVEAEVMPEILQRIADEDDALATLLFDEVPDYTYVRGIHSQAGQFAAQATGFRGSNAAVYSDASAAGMGALELGCRLLDSGEADRVIIIGVAAPAATATLVANNQLDPLGDDPSRDCGPFGANRRGGFVGMGGAALVLETSAAARAGGRTVVAELASCCTVVSSEAEDALAAAVELVLGEAARPPDAWWAHAAGSRRNDNLECAVVGARLGGATPVTSSKATFGNAFACSALIDVVLGVESLVRGSLPPVGLLSTPDPLLGDLDILCDAPRSLPASAAAIVTSLGQKTSCAGAAMIVRNAA